MDLLGETFATAVARGFDVQLENLPGTWADTSAACGGFNHLAYGLNFTVHAAYILVVKQDNAEIRFEVGDLLAERRLRDMQD